MTLFALTLTIDGTFFLGAGVALVVTLLMAGIFAMIGDDKPGFLSGTMSGIVFFISELVLIPVFIGALIAAGVIGGAAWSAFFGWAVVRIPAFIYRFSKLK